MSNEESKGEYEVGYRKPPKSTQFQKGISGNRAGRPKKAMGFDQQLLREANLPVVINENGKQVRVTKLAVAIRQWVHKSMRGDSPATKSLVISYQQASERDAVAWPQQGRGSEPFAHLNPDDLTDDMMKKILLAAYKRNKLADRKQLRAATSAEPSEHEEPSERKGTE